MTLLETVIALAIAFSVVTGALEASRMAATRAGLAKLQMEAAVKAEKLIAAVGTEFPLAGGHDEGREGGGINWSLDVRPYQPVPKGAAAFDVSAHVQIRRGELVAQQDVATLKQRLEPSP